jgi:signal transduction histidine kinase
MNANRAFSNKNFQSSLSEMEVKYETEKKELKISALEKEKRLINKLGVTGGAVLLLALAAFFFLWRWNVQKKRVADKQKQIAEQQVKQLEQEKQLIATQAVLDGETTERARLARDLHDSLGSMLTGVKLSLLDMKKDVKLEYVDVQRFDKAMGMLDQSVKEMRRVAHHLMPDSLSRFGLKPAVSNFCNNFPAVSFAYFGDESRLDSKLEVMIYRSIYELVNNALKHSGAGKILVQIIQEPDRIAFTVQDNGCGFNPSAVGQGMGLHNIRTRVAAYNGILNIDSRPKEGTEINVELKVES